MRIETQLDHAGRAGVGRQALRGGDLGDAAREIDILLGHPLDDVLGALVVAVDRVGAAELEVDVCRAQRHARVVAERLARLPDGGDEADAGSE